jgi:O-antigen/teichoic acid export membrane protein
MRLPTTNSVQTRNYYHSYLKGNFWIGLGQGLYTAKGIIFLPLLIRILGVTAYGAYTIISSLVPLLFTLSSFGVSFYYHRFFPTLKTVEDKRVMFYRQFYFQGIIILVLSLLLVIFQQGIKGILFGGIVNFSVWLFCLLLLSYFFCYQVGGYFRLSNRMALFAVTQGAVPYVEIGLILVLAIYFAKIGINEILFANTVALLVIATPLYKKMLNEIGVKKGFGSIGNIRQELSFGFPLLLSFVVDFIVTWGDHYVISILLSPTEVGYYRPAYALGSLTRFIPQLFIYSMPVYLSRILHDGNHDDARKLVSQSIRFFLVFGICFAVFSLVFGYEILSFLATSEVAAKGYVVMPIVAVAMIFYGLNIIMGEVLFVQLKVKEILRANTIAALLNLVLNFLLIYYLRTIYVAAFTTLLSYCLSFWILFRELHSIKIVRYEVEMIWRIVLGSVLAGLIGYVLLQFVSHSAFWFAFVLIVTSVLFGWLMFLLGVVTRVDLKTITHSIFKSTE